MKHLVLVLIVLIAGITGAFVIRPVAAANCADISLSYSPMQMYAPVTLQITFQFTTTRSADWKPLGLSTGASIDPGTNHITFKANQNDTYHVWFAVFYDTPVTQNVTFVTQEGSRPPISLPLCMSGTSIYIVWQAITIIPEPQYPSTPDIWQYGSTVISAAMDRVQVGLGSISNQNIFTQVLVAIGILVSLAAFAQATLAKRKIRGYT